MYENIKFGNWKSYIHSSSKQIQRIRDSKQINPGIVNYENKSATFTENNEIYETTLNSCTCTDFKERNLPCKHIYRLAALTGDFKETTEQENDNLSKTNNTSNKTAVAPKKYTFIALVLIIVLIVGCYGYIKYQDKKRYDTIHFAEDLADAAENYERKSDIYDNYENTYESDVNTSPLNSIKYGELLNSTVTELDGKRILVVKAKIEPNLTNRLTIDQNYYNVADIVQNHSGILYDEIQYWAVADMTDGSESKVISFTIDHDVISGINNKTIAENQIGDYATDLFILPSLLE